jgi:hypothetical protein
VHTNGERKARLDPYQDVVTDHLAKAEKIKVTIHPLIFQHVYSAYRKTHGKYGNSPELRTQKYL